MSASLEQPRHVAPDARPVIDTHSLPRWTGEPRDRVVLNVHPFQCGAGLTGDVSCSRHTGSTVALAHLTPLLHRDRVDCPLGTDTDSTELIGHQPVDPILHRVL